MYPVKNCDYRKVNGYVVVKTDDLKNPVYECERKYWDKSIREIFNEYCEINRLYWSFDVSDYEVGYFAILEE